jgi:acyl carrier protein
MANGDMTSKLNGVFQQVFDDPTLQLSRVMTADDVVGWDSLSHVNLIVAIEREFKIRFTTREIAGLKNVGELMDLIAGKGGVRD